MIPKEFGFNQSESTSSLFARLAWRFPGSPATARDGKLIQMSHSCHHIEAIDYVPVWRVSLWRVSVWRDASLARFTLARFPFFCLTAQKCFLCQFGSWSFGTYLVLRLCWSNMRVWCVARAAYTFVSFLRKSVFYARIYILRSFPCVSCIISLLILSTCHRGYTIADLFISRLRLQNGCATQRDVGVVIVQCSRSEDVPVAFNWLMISMLLETACDTIYSCSITM